MQRHPLSGGVLFSHHSDVAGQPWPWKNFEPRELACTHCGELYWLTSSFDALQRARDALGAPMRINSAHRCRMKNLAVGGAPRSAHLYVAFDVSTRGRDPREVLEALMAGGFRSVGYYRTFIHVDERPGRRWYGSVGARAYWRSLERAMTADVTL